MHLAHSRRLAACAALLAVVACSDPPPPPTKAPAAAKEKARDREERLEAEFTDSTTVDFWRDDTLFWKLRTSLLRQELHSQRIAAKPVNLVAFGPKGDEMATVVSDSGSMERNLRYFRAWGHVVGQNVNGVRLRTDSIVFDKEANRIFTSARVEVRTEAGDILTGKGFRSDAHFDHWEILSDVRGTLFNPSQLRTP